MKQAIIRSEIFLNLLIYSIKEIFLAVGISYARITKKHTCKVEEL